MASPVNKRLERSSSTTTLPGVCPGHLTDGERGSAQFNARIRADVEGAFGMKLFIGHHVAKGVRADFKFSVAHIDGFEFVHVVPVVDMRMGEHKNQGFARVFADQGQNFLTGEMPVSMTAARSSPSTM